MTSVQSSANHIISLALKANESFVVDLKHQTLETSTWDLFEVENSSTPSYFYQYLDNSTSMQYATNDTFSNSTKDSAKPRTSTEIPIWLIPCYSIILIFAIIGNLLVASTLFQNRRMRTITNVFLANLAISDMLLGVLCMPITLVGTYLRHFIFGEWVCKFIQFAQAVSVAVSSWTLVAISCERYYAICHPLRSRTWQTITHAYKIIGCIWFGSIICMAPIAIFSQLIPTSRQGLRKCREQWPEEAVGYERFYNIFLDLVLLVLPLAVLCVAYILITRTLYMGIRDEKALILKSKNNNMINDDSVSSATAEGKVHTQVETEVKAPKAFHLKMSLRYHTRKSGTFASASSSEPLQIVKTAGNNSREQKYFTSTDVENKYSAMGSVSSSVAGTMYGRRGLCYNSSENTHVETEISFTETKDQKNNREEKSKFHQQSDDDITLIGSCGSSEIKGARTTDKKRGLTSRTTEGPQPHLSCMRSASIRSLNQNYMETAQHVKYDASTSCFSLNTMPTEHFTRNQQIHQSFNHKHLQQNLPNKQNMHLTPFYRQKHTTEFGEKQKLNSAPSLCITESVLRRSNLEKNLESKKRVVKMLFVLVLEFFICWTPLYVINTVAMFIGPAIYEYVDYTTISFFQLLAYSSSCCNPITYCFMNASFRRAFVDTFKGMHLNGGSFWHKRPKNSTNLSVAGNSIAMANSYTAMTANSVIDSPRL